MAYELVYQNGKPYYFDPASGWLYDPSTGQFSDPYSGGEEPLPPSQIPPGAPPWWQPGDPIPPPIDNPRYQDPRTGKWFDPRTGGWYEGPTGSTAESRTARGTGCCSSRWPMRKGRKAT